MDFAEPQLDNDVGKDSDKFALFKKIQENKGILFGKFSPNVTKESKEAMWNQIRGELIHDGHEFFREKTTKQMKEWMAVAKTRTVKKYDNAKKTGTGKIAKFTELEKLVLAIADTESPQVKGVDVEEAGIFDTESEIRPPTPVTPKAHRGDVRRIAKFAPGPSKRQHEDETSIDDQIKQQKLRKLRLENQKLEKENQLLDLQIEEKEIQLSMYQIIPAEKEIVINDFDSC
ncbi:hypothetical protein Ddc_21909 [Ditylenchus destructor]|nr:hypothetical protein Ddc_21909 [Ditylenchus destructor]